jgi:hypothetical protein
MTPEDFVRAITPGVKQPEGLKNSSHFWPISCQKW